MKESAFQAKLIREIKKRFPGAIVLKNDPNYIQGFPDLTILYKDRWAVLEIKQSEKRVINQIRTFIFCRQTKCLLEDLFTLKT